VLSANALASSEKGDGRGSQAAVRRRRSAKKAKERDVSAQEGARGACGSEEEPAASAEIAKGGSQDPGL